MAVGMAEGVLEEGDVGPTTLDVVILALQHLEIPTTSSKTLLRRPNGGLARKLMVSKAIFIWLMLG